MTALWKGTNMHIACSWRHLSPPCYSGLHRANATCRDVLSLHRNSNRSVQSVRVKLPGTASAAAHNNNGSTGSSDGLGGNGGGSGGKSTSHHSGDWQPGKDQPKLSIPNILGLAAVTYVVLGLTQPWSLLTRTTPIDTSQQTVGVVIPVLNESVGINETLRHLHQLTPAVHEIIVVDGGSTDNTLQLVRRSGLCSKALTAAKGRASQMNAGAAAAESDLLCFLHADTQPPQDLVFIMRRELSDPQVVLAGFSPSIEVPGQKLHLMSFHNMIKSYYAPMLFRPLAFLRGLRCLFGDQALFCRRKDFVSAGGFDPRLSIMEDADLCIRMHEAGPTTAAQKHVRHRSTKAAIHRTQESASTPSPTQYSEQPFQAGLSSLAKPPSQKAAPHPLLQQQQQQQHYPQHQHHQQQHDYHQMFGSMMAWCQQLVQPRGRIKQVLDRECVTSGRRIAAWGSLRATYVHVVIGLNWYLGKNPQQLRELYDKMYTDSFR